MRRPGWLAWALGSQRRLRLTVRTPVARLGDRWLTLAPGSPLRVRFDQPVSTVSYRQPGQAPRTARGEGRRAVTLPFGRRPAAGSVDVAASARAWERTGPPVRVSWFPRAPVPVVLSRPAAGTAISPGDPITLVFSQPVASVLGTAHPAFSPAAHGHWREVDSHTLVFVPSGLGIPLGRELKLRFPVPVAEASTAGVAQTTRTLGWTVPAASFLRLQQLLARQGYLPLDWQPAAGPVARTPLAQLAAAVQPPAGRFSWRYRHTPHELKALWSAGRPNTITRGAVMAFEHDHHLTVDAIAGARVWHALLADAVTGRRRRGGYSYVYVHRRVPQKLTLWHNGKVVLTSPWKHRRPRRADPARHAGRSSSTSRSER